jgi:hypothetical protein
MSVIDLKNCTIKFCDGRQGTITLSSAPADSDLTFTAVKHLGSRPLRIRTINPGTNNASLTITSSGLDFTISLATNGSAVATSTAAAIKAAWNADATASSFATCEDENAGAGLVDVIGYQSVSTGPRTLTIKVGEGSISWTEKSPREFIKDRGRLSTVRNGDEEPVDVRLDVQWEFIKATTGSGTPTPVEVVRNTGEAATWVTTDTDTCAPYCVDIEIFNDVPCAGTLDEYVLLEEFRVESVDYDLKGNRFSFSGRLNKTKANVVRG